MAIDSANSPRLVVTEPADQAGLVLTLSAPELVIGHSDTADLVLDDRFVSRRHALVTVDPDGAVTIRDLNSTGGTFVNEERLTGPRVLEPGDIVRFADLQARFEPAAAATVGADAPTQVMAMAADAGALPPTGEGHVNEPGVTPAGESIVPAAPPYSAGQPDSVVTGNQIYTVTGTVTSPALPGVPGLTVQLVDKNVGGDQVLGSTQTASDGSYGFNGLVITLKYLTEYHKTQPDLQVQVSAGTQFLAASQVSYSAPTTVTLDVVVPAGTPGLPSEYEVLTAALAAVYPGPLSDLQEGNGRYDLTYAGNKAAVDVRAVALLALASQFSQITVPVQPPAAEPGATHPMPAAGHGPVVILRPEFYYALFRAGLPASQDTLYQTDSGTVQAIWQQATAQGVIPEALAADIPSAVRSFQALSAARILTAAPPAGVSTLQEMLQGTLTEAAQQQQFAQLYTQSQGDWTNFWPAAEKLFGSAATARLQLTGQLYYLTVNNQPLVSALMGADPKNPLTSAQDLAARGYYTPDTWAPLIGSTVPPGIPGADADEQASNYAELLAAQVRTAFPTAVMADQIGRGILPVVGTGQTPTEVADFLTENQGQFEIGAEPVEAYLARTGATAPLAPVITEIKRLQRAYQLTPDDTSLAVLLRHNLDSAFAVTRYDAAGFTRAFAEKLGGADKAAAIHARARQIFAATLSVTVSYLSGRAGAGPRRASPGPVRVSPAAGRPVLSGGGRPDA